MTVALFRKKYFHNSEGKIVILQRPNLPILVYVAAIVLQRFWQDNRALELIAFGSLFAWAWLEILYGVNYFRRTIGIIILAYMIVTRL